jgi:putative inorganic carbon (HCO3(-)) transporter
MPARVVWRPRWWAWTLLGLAALAFTEEVVPSHLRGHGLIITPLLIVVGVLVLRRLWELPPAVTMCAAIVLTVFSGAWAHIGLGNLPLDRLLIVFVLLQFLLKAPGTALTPSVRVRSVHILMGLTIIYVVISAAAAGSLTTEKGLLSLLDQFGVIPYVMFLLAPAIFAGERERNVLLATLVVLGAYLGLTAIFESLGPRSLVFPHYILETDAGLSEEGRAGGPFQAVIAEGFATFACSVLAMIAFVQWNGQRRRYLAAAVAVICIVGCFLTLERGVWLAAIVASVVTALATRTGRKWLTPALVACAIAFGGALALSPSFAHTISNRTGDQSTVWARENQIAAGSRMLAAKPLFGFGWSTFSNHDLEYFRRSEDYPMVGYVIERYGSLGPFMPLHETYLAYAVEIGLIGALLWLSSLLWGVGGAIFARAPADLRAWKLGLLATTLCFLIIALVNPYQASFAVLLMWVWAGIASGDARAPVLSRARTALRRSSSRAPAPAWRSSATA